MNSRAYMKKLSDTTWEGRKSFSIPELKVGASGDSFYISGYANTKNKPDSYGDIPTNYMGAPIYDLSRIQKNPVMLIDHDNSVGAIMGNFVELVEDGVGLYFKALLMPQDGCPSEKVRQAVFAFKTGFARGISIGGRWGYNDPKNPAHLTNALIFEISGVAVPADEDSLSTTIQKPKSTEAEEKLDPVSLKNDLGVIKRRIIGVHFDFVRNT